MKKYVLLALFLAAGCGIPYDGDAIATLETQLVDSQNAPLEGKSLRIDATVQAAPDNGSNSSMYVKYSDAEGKFKFDFFKPTGNFFIDIAQDDAEYLPVRLANLSKEDITGHKLILDKIYLYKLGELADLTVLLNQVSSNKYIQKIEIIGRSYQDRINFGLSQDESLTTNFKILKNQDFVLKYYVGTLASSTVETFQENLSIGTNPINYTITF